MLPLGATPAGSADKGSVPQTTQSSKSNTVREDINFVRRPLFGNNLVDANGCPIGQLLYKFINGGLNVRILAYDVGVVRLRHYDAAGEAPDSPEWDCLFDCYSAYQRR